MFHSLRGPGVPHQLSFLQESPNGGLVALFLALWQLPKFRYLYCYDREVTIRASNIMKCDPRKALNQAYSHFVWP